MEQKEHLKNYTTSISPIKTIAEIEMTLSLHGATHVHKEYDGLGNVKAIIFVLKTEHGEIPFKMPAKPEAVKQILMDQKARKMLNIPKKEAADIDHARRVCWRIIKDWVESQIAMIEINQAKAEEVFMPFMLTSNTGETLFQRFEKQGFQRLLSSNLKEDEKPKKDAKDLEYEIQE